MIPLFSVFDDVIISVEQLNKDLQKMSDWASDQW